MNKTLSAEQQRAYHDADLINRNRHAGLHAYVVYEGRRCPACGCLVFYPVNSEGGLRCGHCWWPPGAPLWLRPSGMKITTTPALVLMTSNGKEERPHTDANG